MSNESENQRAALEEARNEARANADPDGEGMPGWFLAIFVVLVIGGLVAFAFKVDPCIGQRLLWWVNAEGAMRSCAFAAKCSINDGSMPHVSVGSGYIWFDGSAPECSVQF